ncbi:MAG: hypothetical protein EOO53_08135 [Gammaproteobacteria bacterium]|nr:MAG: hypothetical protein EOO53_08135 [Gammaproteobacteria bacterium]
MIYSMFAMIILTFVVAGYLLKLRIDAVKAGTVKLSVFRLNNPAEMPTTMLQTSSNYSNLFEMPMLFYIAGTLAIILNLQTPTMIILSWLFVAVRAAHSWIHITSNNVVRRFQAFVMSSICMLLMWIILVWQYSTVHMY